jgi:hypothetical protein
MRDTLVSLNGIDIPNVWVDNNYGEMAGDKSDDRGELRGLQSQGRLTHLRPFGVSEEDSITYE